MRGFTSTNNISSCIAHGDLLATLQAGDPFATLVKLPGQRNIRITYAPGVLTTSAPPGSDGRAEGFGWRVVKGKLIVLTEERVDGAAEAFD